MLSTMIFVKIQKKYWGSSEQEKCSAQAFFAGERIGAVEDGKMRFCSIWRCQENVLAYISFVLRNFTNVIL